MEGGMGKVRAKVAKTVLKFRAINYKLFERGAGSSGLTRLRNPGLQFTRRTLYRYRALNPRP